MADCIAANERSVELQKRDHLIEALRELATCAALTCPEVIQQACGKRIADVNSAMPSLVFDVKDSSGHAIAGVQVSICKPSASTSSWTNAPEGYSCAASKVCSAGSCDSGCYIGGAFYSAGAVDPDNGASSASRPAAPPAGRTRHRSPLAREVLAAAAFA